MSSRVLVVDDDPVACQLMKEILLHATGMEVLALTEGAAAVQHLAEEKFAVILLDLRMPPPDGNEVTRMVRKAGLNLRTPIIMVSDDQSTRAVSTAFAAGTNFFLYKPLDKTRLLRLVRATHGAVEHERRRFRRVPLQTRVQVQFDQKEIEGETIDISLSGMLIKMPADVPDGAPIRIRLYALDSGVPIIGSGSVVRTLSGNRVGIQMHRMAPIESNRLQEFLLPLIANDDHSVPAFTLNN